jgi:membrane protease YdiL (CAAX protease family)
LAMHTIQPSIPQNLFSDVQQLVGLPFFALVVCVAAPIGEEILFRYLPAVKPRNNDKKLSKGVSRRHADVSSNERFYHAAISLLFGGSHIANHIGLGWKLADISFQSMQAATIQCVTSFLFASITLVPLFRRRGLAAAIGAHMAWNTSVMLLLLLANQGQWTVISAAVLALLCRLARRLFWAMTKQGKENQRVAALE